VQSDNKVLIGGGFTTVNGDNRNHVARLNADGTLDGTFENGLGGTDGEVWSVAVQGDGKVLVGGPFSEVNQEPHRGLARLSTDGTLDSAVPGVGGSFDFEAWPSVNTVALQSDGKVVIGGNFEEVIGVNQRGIARLNADGTLDTGFLNGLSGVNSYVNSVAVQIDGKIIIGGAFDSVNEENRNAIARLNTDGTLDSSFLNGLSGVKFPLIGRDYGFVFSVAVQRDSKVLIGGWFTEVNGESRNGIARLDPDGALDRSFLGELSGFYGDYPLVSSVSVQSDGKVLVGRNFTTVNGVGRNYIARLNPDGTLDSTFQNGLSGANNIVRSIAVQSDGKVLIGGEFTAINGVPAAGIARLWGSADFPPQIKSIARSGGEVNLSWYTIPNRTYRVQYTGDLSATNWTDFAGDVSAFGATASKTETTAGNASQRFYRVVLLP
jgi:uncharacterized delta-60 repeat protein